MEKIKDKILPVLMDEDMHTDFKVASVQNKISMGERARLLIEISLIAPKMLGAFKIACAQDGISVGEQLRRLIDRFLSQHSLPQSGRSE